MLRLHADADNVFVSEGKLVVQVRRGTMTHETLDVVERHVMGLAEVSAMAMCVVFEETAVVPGPDVRKRQQGLVQKALARPGVHVGIVILETGVKGTMLRTISRTMSLGASRVATFGTIEASARWLSPVAGMPGSAIVEVVAQARNVSHGR